MSRGANRKRVKVSMSLDPAVLEYLDAYVEEHPTLDRSHVVESALREFRQRQVEDELEAQYAEPESEVIQREWDNWRQIRRAAVRRALGGE